MQGDEQGGGGENTKQGEKDTTVRAWLRFRARPSDNILQCAEEVLTTSITQPWFQKLLKFVSVTVDGKMLPRDDINDYEDLLAGSLGLIKDIISARQGLYNEYAIYTSTGDWTETFYFNMWFDVGDATIDKKIIYTRVLREVVGPLFEKCYNALMPSNSVEEIVKILRFFLGQYMDEALPQVEGFFKWLVYDELNDKKQAFEHPIQTVQIDGGFLNALQQHGQDNNQRFNMWMQRHFVPITAWRFLSEYTKGGEQKDFVIVGDQALRIHSRLSQQQKINGHWSGQFGRIQQMYTHEGTETIQLHLKSRDAFFKFFRKSKPLEIVDLSPSLNEHKYKNAIESICKQKQAASDCTYNRVSEFKINQSDKEPKVITMDLKCNEHTSVKLEALHVYDQFKDLYKEPFNNKHGPPLPLHVYTRGIHIFTAYVANLSYMTQQKKAGNSGAPYDAGYIHRPQFTQMNSGDTHAPLTGDSRKRPRPQPHEVSPLSDIQIFLEHVKYEMSSNGKALCPSGPGRQYCNQSESTAPDYLFVYETRQVGLMQTEYEKTLLAETFAAESYVMQHDDFGTFWLTYINANHQAAFMSKFDTHVFWTKKLTRGLSVAPSDLSWSIVSTKQVRIDGQKEALLQYCGRHGARKADNCQGKDISFEERFLYAMEIAKTATAALCLLAKHKAVPACLEHNYFLRSESRWCCQQQHAHFFLGDLSNVIGQDHNEFPQSINFTNRWFEKVFRYSVNEEDFQAVSLSEDSGDPGGVPLHADDLDDLPEEIKVFKNHFRVPAHIRNQNNDGSRLRELHEYDNGLYFALFCVYVGYNEVIRLFMLSVNFQDSADNHNEKTVSMFVRWANSLQGEQQSFLCERVCLDDNNFIDLLKAVIRKWDNDLSELHKQIETADHTYKHHIWEVYEQHMLTLHDFFKIPWSEYIAPEQNKDKQSASNAASSMSSVSDWCARAVAMLEVE